MEFKKSFFKMLRYAATDIMKLQHINIYKKAEKVY